jgi:hypothetical protein
MPDRPLVGGHPHPGEVHPHHAAHAPRLQDGAIDESLELKIVGVPVRRCTSAGLLVAMTPSPDAGAATRARRRCLLRRRTSPAGGRARDVLAMIAPEWSRSVCQRPSEDPIESRCWGGGRLARRTARRRAGWVLPQALTTPRLALACNPGTVAQSSASGRSQAASEAWAASSSSPTTCASPRAKVGAALTHTLAPITSAPGLQSSTSTASVAHVRFWLESAFSIWAISAADEFVGMPRLETDSCDWGAQSCRREWSLDKA